MKLTDRQQRYADARAEGRNRKDAALEAGCPPKSASQAASVLESNTKVTAYWEGIGYRPDGPRVKDRTEAKTEKAATAIDEKAETPLAKYDDPLEFLRDVVNDSAEDPKLRLDAAKAWDNSLRGRASNKGKKAEQEDRAKEVANRFAPPMPPKLERIK